MKVVINRCYGGYGLSALALQTYWLKKGVVAAFYTRDGSYAAKELRRIPASSAGTYGFYVSDKDYGEKFTDPCDGTVKWLREGDISRADPLLVETVEELGTEAASGYCAKLLVVEIPAAPDTLYLVAEENWSFYYQAEHVELRDAYPITAAPYTKPHLYATGAWGNSPIQLGDPLPRIDILSPCVIYTCTPQAVARLREKCPELVALLGAEQAEV